MTTTPGDIIADYDEGQRERLRGEIETVVRALERDPALRAHRALMTLLHSLHNTPLEAAAFQLEGLAADARRAVEIVDEVAEVVMDAVDEPDLDDVSDLLGGDA